MAELSEQILQNLMPVGGGLGSKHGVGSMCIAGQEVAQTDFEA